jgi:predicted RNA-binding protein with TRAM domain
VVGTDSDGVLNKLGETLADSVLIVPVGEGGGARISGIFKVARLGLVVGEPGAATGTVVEIKVESANEEVEMERVESRLS